MDIGDLHLVGDRTSLAFPLVGDSRYVFVNSYDVKSIVEPMPVDL